MGIHDITDEQWAKRSDRMSDLLDGLLTNLWNVSEPTIYVGLREDSFLVQISDYYTEELIASHEINYADFVNNDLEFWYPGERLNIIQDRITALEKLIELYKSKQPQLEAWCDEYEAASDVKKDQMIAEHEKDIDRLS